MFFLEKENYWMTVFLMVIFTVFMFFSLMLMLANKSFVLEWVIMSSVGADMLFNFYMDWMSVTFFSFVSLISGSILFYSGSYMEEDNSFRMFMFLVILFIISMFFLVFSLNLVSMMLGWDGLGIISYILVVYYKNEKSSSAGMITVLSNRVGDAALMVSVACLFEMGSWNYMFMNINKESLFYYLICLAAITKSAQIPFSAWLPAAMAAPTPVSALVHSSTLVTAGVYLLIRFSNLMKDLVAMNLLMYLSMLTTIMASTTALFEVDFKKVVALSTLSQLGIMVMTLSFGLTKLAFVHMLVHAMFKALLFMCSGKVIHSVMGKQDIRKMGGMVFNLPITGMLMNLSSFALCGVPFMSGFYSKDLILEIILNMDNFFFNYFLYMMIVGLSMSYSFRMIYFSMISISNQNGDSFSEESDWVMLWSKLGLAMMTIFSGSLLIWLSTPFPVMISLTVILKLFAFCSMLLGAFMGLVLCFSNLKSSVLIYSLNKTIAIMMLWNLPILSGSVMGMLSKMSDSGLKTFDLGWNEILSGPGFNYMFLEGGSSLMTWLNNVIKGGLVIFILGGFMVYII